MVSVYHRVGKYAFGDPGIPPNHRMMTDGSVAPQDGAPSIDHHMILNGGVTLGFCQFLLHGKGSQGHALVDLHMLTDPGSLPYNYSGSMIDEKRRTNIPRRDLCTIPVLLMSILCHHPRNHRYVQIIKDIGQAVNRNTVEARITKNDLLNTAGGRVETGNGLGIWRPAVRILREASGKTGWPALRVIVTMIC